MMPKHVSHHAMRAQSLRIIRLVQILIEISSTTFGTRRINLNQTLFTSQLEDSLYFQLGSHTTIGSNGVDLPIQFRFFFNRRDMWLWELYCSIKTIKTFIRAQYFKNESYTLISFIAKSKGQKALLEKNNGCISSLYIPTYIDIQNSLNFVL